jgi:hypothetical protein
MTKHVHIGDSSVSNTSAYFFIFSTWAVIFCSTITLIMCTNSSKNITCESKCAPYRVSSEYSTQGKCICDMRFKVKSN